jgi:oligopeptide/dipeptide ABC transporter ATP-binding protein
MSHENRSGGDGVPTEADRSDALLRVTQLVVDYPSTRGRGTFRAVDRVDFEIGVGETLGLVGESGSGKTTIGRAVLGLTRVSDGNVWFDGHDITTLSRARRRDLGRKLQVVFQDPYSSLNPVRTIGQTLTETARASSRASRAQARNTVVDIIERVGLTSDVLGRYPSSFSGGQRQRIAIARALVAKPRLIVCDEPTSALDLSVQAQVLNLLKDLQQDFGLSYLFISHDLSVVRHMAHRVAVLYRGQLLEEGDAKSVYEQPLHPYTKTLVAAAPVPDPGEQRRRRISHDDGVAASAEEQRRPPSAEQGNIGAAACVFAPRCQHAVDECISVRPKLEDARDSRVVACLRWAELDQDSGQGTAYPDALV